MSLNRRIELVEQHRDCYGLNACLRAMEISKGTWYYRQQKKQREDKDNELKEQLREIIEEHPSYGYRRIGPEIEERTGEKINHKRLRRLLNQWEMALRRLVSRPKPSAIRSILKENHGVLNLVKGWVPSPLELLSADFTEVLYDQGRRKAHLMAMVDVASSLACGWAVGISANRELALQCWEKVKRTFTELGRDLAGTVVHTDQDSVYTSFDWLRALIVDSSVVVSFSERGAMDNPWIESFWGRFKVENGSLIVDAQTLDELIVVIDRAMWYYNTKRRHSSLDYQAPLQFLKIEGIAPVSVSAA